MEHVISIDELTIEAETQDPTRYIGGQDKLERWLMLNSPSLQNFFKKERKKSNATYFLQ